MSTRFHMNQSVRGALLHWSDNQWTDAVSWITKDDGSSFASGAALKQEFEKMLAQGIECLPLGPCNNFDPKKGCLGHREPDTSIVLDLRATP